jgi:transcription-repair coupling factor (superfamily II helicase)
MRRELDRGGQVFFVHNRVQSLGIIAEQLKRLVPDATIAIAHGQMPPAELDHAMREFLDGERRHPAHDVHHRERPRRAHREHAHRRSRRLLRPRAALPDPRPRRPLTPPRLLLPAGAGRGHEDAEKRLRILEHYTELGSGYHIAMKDLELRGAGNLLGAEQSGFVTAVGLDTYTRLLEDTIKRMKGDVPSSASPPTSPRRRRVPAR